MTSSRDSNSGATHNLVDDLESAFQVRLVKHVIFVVVIVSLKK